MSRRTIKCYLNHPVIPTRSCHCVPFLHETPERPTCKECIIMQNRKADIPVKCRCQDLSQAQSILFHNRVSPTS